MLVAGVALGFSLLTFGLSCIAYRFTRHVKRDADVLDESLRRYILAQVQAQHATNNVQNH